MQQSLSVPFGALLFLFFSLLLPARKAKLYHVSRVQKLDIFIIKVRKVLKPVCKNVQYLDFTSVDGIL